MWKTHKSKDGKRIAYYDRNLRLWTMLEHDENGAQVGEADYTVVKSQAMQWLEGKAN